MVKLRKINEVPFPLECKQARAEIEQLKIFLDAAVVHYLELKGWKIEEMPDGEYSEIPEVYRHKRYPFAIANQWAVLQLEDESCDDLDYDDKFDDPSSPDYDDGKRPAGYTVTKG